MTKLTKILVALLFTQNAFAVEGVYINETAFELEALYGQIAHTMSKAYLEHGACESNVYISDIVDAARKSRRHHDSNYEHNLNTGDLFSLTQTTKNALKSTLALKDIMNMLDHSDPRTFEHALNRVIMWGAAPGAYGHTTYIEFGPNNTFTYHWLELLNDEPWWVWHEVQGEFSVESKNYNSVIVELNYFDERPTERFELYKEWIDAEWMMKPEGQTDSNPYFDGYVDLPSECDA
jgi:hypothetical protein